MIIFYSNDFLIVNTTFLWLTNWTGHVLFEMCSGYELYAPKPTARHLEDLHSYPQVGFFFQHWCRKYKCYGETGKNLCVKIKHIRVVSVGSSGGLSRIRVSDRFMRDDEMSNLFVYRFITYLVWKQVIEVLDYIFNNPSEEYPTIASLAILEFFRNIDLREMRCSTVILSSLTHLIEPIQALVQRV